jgi:hypothetical protein
MEGKIVGNTADGCLRGSRLWLRSRQTIAALKTIQGARLVFCSTIRACDCFLGITLHVGPSCLECFIDFFGGNCESFLHFHAHAGKGFANFIGRIGCVCFFAHRGFCAALGAEIGFFGKFFSTVVAISHKFTKFKLSATKFKSCLNVRNGFYVLEHYRRVP